MASPYQQGRNAALAGLSPVGNPHCPLCVEHTQWLCGYHSTRQLPWEMAMLEALHEYRPFSYMYSALRVEAAA